MRGGERRGLCHVGKVEIFSSFYNMNQADTHSPAVVGECLIIK